MNPLTAYREKHRMTQGALAELLQISRPLLCQIEAGNRQITPENAKRWEGVLGISKKVLCPRIFA